MFSEMSALQKAGVGTVQGGVKSTGDWRGTEGLQQGSDGTACGWPGTAGKRLTSHPQEVRLMKDSTDGSKQGKTVYGEQIQSAGLGNKWVKCEQEQAESK